MGGAFEPLVLTLFVIVWLRDPAQAYLALLTVLGRNGPSLALELGHMTGP